MKINGNPKKEITYYTSYRCFFVGFLLLGTNFYRNWWQQDADYLLTFCFVFYSIGFVVRIFVLLLLFVCVRRGGRVVAVVGIDQ